MNSNPLAFIRYLAFLNQQSGGLMQTLRGTIAPQLSLQGYPGNHTYKIHAGAILPSFQLWQRWDKIRSFIPANARSFLDLACCRGYYLLQSAGQAETAVGIDVAADFIEQARTAARLTNRPQVHFEQKQLDDLINAGAQPFDLVFLTGAYHYFYWGSVCSDQAFPDHAALFARLARLCGDTLIISARLDVRHLPDNLRARAKPGEKAHDDYTTGHFLQAARQWFDVHTGPSLGRYPLYVMKRRQHPQDLPPPH